MKRNTNFTDEYPALTNPTCPKCKKPCHDIEDGYSDCCGVRLYLDDDYVQDAPRKVNPKQP